MDFSFKIYKSNWLRHLIHLEYAHKTKIVNDKSAVYNWPHSLS